MVFIPQINLNHKKYMYLIIPCSWLEFIVLFFLAEIQNVLLKLRRKVVRLLEGSKKLVSDISTGQLPQLKKKRDLKIWNWPRFRPSYTMLSTSTKIYQVQYCAKVTQANFNELLGFSWLFKEVLLQMKFPRLFHKLSSHLLFYSSRTFER